ncbi:MAG TPA: hypothetical protein VGE52_21435, partial [Pirellulales bacterium]
PEAFVEFVGGDRLPGRVIGLRPAESNPYDRPEDALLVETAIPHEWPLDRSGREPALVSVRWVSRVVWERGRREKLRPGTVFLRDGRRLDYRSIRWTPEGLKLLRESEVVELSYGKIAEVHLPTIDPWDAYYEQLATMNTECETPLWRIATSDGLRATATADRTDATHHGNGGDPNSWRRRIQPAWALTPFWVRWRTIDELRLFPAHKPPLSMFPPSAVTSRHSFGGGWPPRFDANVQGGRLVSGGASRGWGIGVQAACRVEFALPPAVLAFSSSCGLDALAGSGGCAQAVVKLASGSGEQELFRSPPLVGSQTVVATNRLELSPNATRTLILEADSLDQGGPDGADPLDVRDALDWIEPTLECDPALVREEVRRRAPKLIPALAGWVSATGDATPIAASSRWDERRDAPSYRLEVAPREKIFSLQRTLVLGPNDRWLNLIVGRPGDYSQSPKMAIALDGEPLAELEVPVRTSEEISPLRIKLPPVGKKKATLTLTQSPSPANARLDWRGVTTTANPLGLLPIVEDNASVVSLLNEGEGQARWSSDEPFAGKGSLTVVNGLKGTTRLDGLSAAIRDRPALGEYRFLRFAWKKPKGKRIAFHIGHDGAFGREAVRRKEPGFSYEAGRDLDPKDGARSLDRKAPENWQVVDVDLFNDFGPFTFTGFAIESDDGEPAYIDAVYLARDRRDFELIETPRNQK